MAQRPARLWDDERPGAEEAPGDHGDHGDDADEGRERRNGDVTRERRDCPPEAVAAEVKSCGEFADACRPVYLDLLRESKELDAEIRKHNKRVKAYEGDLGAYEADVAAFARWLASYHATCGQYQNAPQWLWEAYASAKQTELELRQRRAELMDAFDALTAARRALDDRQQDYVARREQLIARMDAFLRSLRCAPCPPVVRLLYLTRALPGPWEIDRPSREPSGVPSPMEPPSSRPRDTPGAPFPLAKDTAAKGVSASAAALRLGFESDIYNGFRFPFDLGPGIVQP